MIDHLSFYTTQYDRAKLFYEAAFATLRYAKTRDLVARWDADWPTRRMCAFGPGDDACFWLIETKEAATPRHVAFQAQNRASVEAFYEAAMKHGGQDHGAPGLRPQYHEHYFAAFVIDPDGNNVEAVCHSPQ
jgi:catechol 2,3-dioxygenase-like lactoylglutathione lyase family enzyme